MVYTSCVGVDQPMQILPGAQNDTSEFFSASSSAPSTGGDWSLWYGFGQAKRKGSVFGRRSGFSSRPGTFEKKEIPFFDPFEARMLLKIKDDQSVYPTMFLKINELLFFCVDVYENRDR